MFNSMYYFLFICNCKIYCNFWVKMLKSKSHSSIFFQLGSDYFCFCGFNSGHRLSLRSSPRVPHRLDSDAALPESKPTVASTTSSQSHDSPQTLSSVNEESMSLAQRKGPLPPIPIHARIATLRLNCNASVQNFDSTIPIPSWMPPPPSYQAPTVPPSSVVSMCSYIVAYDINVCKYHVIISQCVCCRLKIPTLLEWSTIFIIMVTPLSKCNSTQF